MDYWIKDCGAIVSCDGDVDPLNHEQVVQTHLLAQIVDAIRNNGHDMVASLIEESCFDDGYDLEHFKENLHCEWDSWEQDGIIPPTDDIYGEVERMAGDTGLFTMVVDRHDLRNYAVTKLGWIRIQGGHIEIPNLRRCTLELLCDGLFEIYGEGWECDTYHINDLQTNKFYLDVKGLDLSSASKIKRSKEMATG